MNLRYFTSVLILFLVVSCHSKTRNNQGSKETFEADSISLKLKYAEIKFVVPSPGQTALLLKKSNIGFYDDLITPSGSMLKFTTTTQKSLAMGVLGADLSYLNLYNQREACARYLQNVQSLMSDLQITLPIDKEAVKRLEANIGNNDSVLYYLGNLYRNADLYLKANDRRDICSLIIAGGWVESFYFLTQIYSKTPNEEIFTLILYQSDILDNLIRILSPFYEKSTEFRGLIDDLVNIAYEFDVVDKVQTTTKVETNTSQKLTTVYNQSGHLLTGSKLNKLSVLADNLRKKILLQ